MLPFSKPASADLGLLQAVRDTVVSCKNPIICSFLCLILLKIPPSGIVPVIPKLKIFCKTAEHSSGSAPFPICTQGGHTNFSSGGEKTTTFPISFTTDKTITTSRHWMSNWNENYYLGGGDNTKFVFTINGTTSSNSRALNWIAIGR